MPAKRRPRDEGEKHTVTSPPVSAAVLVPHPTVAPAIIESAEFDPAVGTLLRVVVGGLNYEVMEEIGTGAFAVVYRCRRSSANSIAHKPTTTSACTNVADLSAYPLNMAVKVTRDENQRQVVQEVLALTAVAGTSPHVVKILGASPLVMPSSPSLQGPNADSSQRQNHQASAANAATSVVALELLHPASLFDFLTRHGTETTERDALHIVRQVLQSIAAVHAAGYLHLDIKLHNFLFRPSDGHVALCDFGLALNLASDDLRFAGGTLAFMAPEVAANALIPRQDRGPVSAAADVWSAGIVAFCVLTHRSPFATQPATPASASGTQTVPANDTASMLQRVQRGEWAWPSAGSGAGKVSVSARRLIERLLRLDPLQRPTASEALDDPVFKRIADAYTIAPPTPVQKFLGVTFGEDAIGADAASMPVSGGQDAGCVASGEPRPSLVAALSVGGASVAPSRLSTMTKRRGQSPIDGAAPRPPFAPEAPPAAALAAAPHDHAVTSNVDAIGVSTAAAAQTTTHRAGTNAGSPASLFQREAAARALLRKMLQVQADELKAAVRLSVEEDQARYTITWLAEVRLDYARHAPHTFRRKVLEFRDANGGFYCDECGVKVSPPRTRAAAGQEYFHCSCGMDLCAACRALLKEKSLVASRHSAMAAKRASTAAAPPLPPPPPPSSTTVPSVKNKSSKKGASAGAPPAPVVSVSGASVALRDTSKTARLASSDDAAATTATSDASDVSSCASLVLTAGGRTPPPTTMTASPSHQELSHHNSSHHTSSRGQTPLADPLSDRPGDGAQAQVLPPPHQQQPSFATAPMVTLTVGEEENGGSDDAAAPVLLSASFIDLAAVGEGESVCTSFSIGRSSIDIFQETRVRAPYVIDASAAAVAAMEDPVWVVSGRMVIAPSDSGWTSGSELVNPDFQNGTSPTHAPTPRRHSRDAQDLSLTTTTTPFSGSFFYYQLEDGRRGVLLSSASLGYSGLLHDPAANGGAGAIYLRDGTTGECSVVSPQELTHHVPEGAPPVDDLGELRAAYAALCTVAADAATEAKLRRVPQYTGVAWPATAAGALALFAPNKGIAAAPSSSLPPVFVDRVQGCEGGLLLLRLSDGRCQTVRTDVLGNGGQNWEVRGMPTADASIYTQGAGAVGSHDEDGAAADATWTGALLTTTVVTPNAGFTDQERMSWEHACGVFGIPLPTGVMVEYGAHPVVLTK